VEIKSEHASQPSLSTPPPNNAILLSAGGMENFLPPRLWKKERESRNLPLLSACAISVISAIFKGGKNGDWGGAGRSKAEERAFKFGAAAASQDAGCEGVWYDGDDKVARGPPGFNQESHLRGVPQTIRKAAAAAATTETTQAAARADKRQNQGNQKNQPH